MTKLDLLKSHKSVTIITSPFRDNLGSYNMILNNLIYILSMLVENISIISSNFNKNKQNYDCNIMVYNIKFNHKENIFLKMISSFVYEIKQMLTLIRISKDRKSPVLILSGTIILPTLTARILRKKTLLVAIASLLNNYKYQYRDSPKRLIILHDYAKIAESLARSFSSYVGTESPNVAKFLNLKIDQSKIIPNEPLYLHNPSFKLLTSFNQRKNIIGYIGRLSEEKGVFEFVTSLRIFLDKHKEYNVQIIGTGPLSEKIHQFIIENKLSDSVKLIGWVNHCDLPKYLNQYKLLVLPSHTEGLPNILLESMSCGTPVLGTTVGGIPDVIKHEINGFLMEDTSPETINVSLENAISHLNTSIYSNNAIKTIKESYSQETIIRIWNDIIDTMSAPNSDV